MFGHSLISCINVLKETLEFEYCVIVHLFYKLLLLRRIGRMRNYYINLWEESFELGKHIYKPNTLSTKRLSLT